MTGRGRGPRSPRSRVAARATRANLVEFFAVFLLSLRIVGIMTSVWRPSFGGVRGVRARVGYGKKCGLPVRQMDDAIMPVRIAA